MGRVHLAGATVGDGEVSRDVLNETNSDPYFVRPGSYLALFFSELRGFGIVGTSSRLEPGSNAREAPTTSRSTAWLVLALAAAADPARAQTVREKARVEVITVRLTARNLLGKRVDDLSAADLVLMVDGKPLAIETFSGPDSAPSTVPAPESGLAAGPSEAGPPIHRPVSNELPLRTLIFVDELETQVIDRKDICAELARYLRAPGSANREYRVVRYDGTILMETGWTRDTETVASAIDRVSRNAPIERLPGPGTLSSETVKNNSFSSLDWVLLHRSQIAEAVLEVLTAFPSGPGENRLLLVTGGTAMLRKGDLAFGLVAGTVNLVPDPPKSDRTYQRDLIAADRAREGQRTAFVLWSRAVNPEKGYELDMDDVVAKALERDVEVVPVFTEALARGEFSLSGRGGPGATVAPGDAGVSLHVSSASAMIGLASETGAEAITVGRRTAARMAEIEGRSAYELTFRDPAADDHEFHRISLACRRLGVKIEYRRGYRVPSEDERTLDLVVAGLRDPERLTNPMQVQARQEPSTDSKHRRATRLALAYAPPLEKGAADERPLAIVAVGQDRSGNRTEPIEWNGTASREEDGPGFEADLLLNVPPDYVWSVAVRDQPTGLTSYLVVPAPPRP
ncbi:MAG TPA: VWA domain-containing protein [Thermoanaerobaculia bacterium]|nr:VWA domain-containing protein [Thermoanaerobaculia bacterium]